MDQSVKFRSTVCLFIALLYFPISGWALKPYEPVLGSPFGESWRWSEMDSLSSYVVRQASRAPDGNLWFAIHGGVVEYDDYAVTPYFLESEIPDDSNVLSILVNKDGLVYVTAKFGAYCLVDGEWKHLFETDQVGYSSGSRISEAPDGSVWFAVSSGLYRVQGIEVQKVDLASNSFSAIFLDSFNRMWLADLESREILGYTLSPDSGMPDESFFSLPMRGSDKESFTVEFTEGAEGRVWIASSSSEHALYWVQDNQATRILENWKEFGSSNRYLVERADGSLWVFTESLVAVYQDGWWTVHEMGDYATWFSFTYVLDDDTFIVGGFTDKTYRFDASDTRWKTYEGLHFQCQDKDGNDWFLTEKREVIRHHKATDSWEIFEMSDGVIDAPFNLFTSSNGWVWAPGSHNGEIAIGWFDGEAWHANLHENLFGDLSRFPPFETDRGLLYFAVNEKGQNLEDSRVGFLVYSQDSGQVDYDTISHTSLAPKIHQISQTADGVWWMGSGSALRSQRGLEPAEIEPGYQGNWIDNMSLAADGTLWVLAWRTGVSRRLTNGDWQSFSPTEYGGGERIVDLIAGKAGNRAWLATTEGISRFDGHHWSQSARMPELNLVRGESWLVESENGSLWVNSADEDWFSVDGPGLESSDRAFMTICFKADQLAPQTQLEGASGKLIESGNALIRWSGQDAWSQTRSADLQFSYRINGGVWSPFLKDSQALLENLSSGNYTLEVRARDTDWNIDPTPAQIQFHVAPFLWKRPWFIISVFLGVLTILVLAYLLIRQRVRHMIAIEEFKIDFFTNISHELRTPLSAIIGPLEGMIKRKTVEPSREGLSMVYRNARRMLGLVNQLLEFRKVELGMLKFEPVRSDLVLFLKDVIYSHVNLWERKQQTFEFEVQPDHRLCGFDPDKLQHMLTNLISNAIKYTPEQGTIRVRAEVHDSDIAVGHGIEGGKGDSGSGPWLELFVEDSGIGISRDRHELIFKPFYRERDQEKEYEGSGIGLAYTYELVNLWGGTISVESPIQGVKGTRFRLYLPLIEDDGSMEMVSSFIADEKLPELEEASADLPSSDAEPEQVKILIVEDNADVREFLCNELADNYRLFVAENGEDALAQAISLPPDLIITDLMMPVMDGLELCRRLKTESETSHIPILVLTARNSDEYRIKGIELGADDYFSKPVNIELLKVRIHSLLESRRMLRERFTRQILIQPEEITVTPLDEQFLRRAIAIVEEHMRDEDFDVELFARKMGMGRASLYRKMKAILGEAPFKFIRSIRLKRAAQLLESGSYNVSEAMEQVGIEGLSHFGKIFKEEFGVIPSEYRNRCLENLESGRQHSDP